MIASGSQRANRLDQIEPVAVGQHVVEDDEVVLLPLGVRQPVGERPGHVGPHAAPREQPLERRRVGLLVIDDQRAKFQAALFTLPAAR